MRTRELKLKLTKKKETPLETIFFQYRLVIRRIKLDANNKVYHTKNGLFNPFTQHSPKTGLHLRTSQGIIERVFNAWDRFFKKPGKEPKLKGMRNQLTSIPLKIVKRVSDWYFQRTIDAHPIFKIKERSESVGIDTVFKNLAILSNWIQYSHHMMCGNSQSLTGPMGLHILHVRYWKYAACEAVLDRDVNFANVILNFWESVLLVANLRPLGRGISI